MTKLLVKFFIGNLDVNEEATRTKYGNLASGVGMVTNTFLFLVKLVIGLMLNSISIIADAVNNITDSLANLIVIIGIKFAKKPPDRKHPFGHARIEYITSLIIAAFMLFLGYEFITSSIESIINPEEIGFNVVLVGILAASGLLKLWQSLFYRKLGKTVNSGPLKALSKDSLMDVIIAIAIISSVIFTHVTGIIIDGYIGVIVSLIILYSGFMVAKETVSKIIGESIDSEQAEKILDFVRSYEGIISVHDLTVHNYGPGKNVPTLHVEMSDTLSLKDAHAIIDEIENDAKAKLDIELLLHIDPIQI
ncbi:MAG: cation diffusion facilitator family transporter [Firmicutes bacterium]|nr:cation diffusion facilitator family transporter [Bacillota bacterium]